MRSSHGDEYRLDMLLIVRIKSNDEESIRSLFNKYLPLVKALYRTYRIRGMDFDDWKQEAVIIMLKCVRRYSQQNRCHFGTFYRAGLRNRFVDLIRKQNAQRRVPAKDLTSFEANEIFYANTLADVKATGPEESILVNETLKQVLRNCSTFEKSILLEIVKQHSFKEIARNNKCSVNKIVGAFSRCRHKFRRLRSTESD